MQSIQVSFQASNLEQLKTQMQAFIGSIPDGSVASASESLHTRAKRTSTKTKVGEVEQVKVETTVVTENAAPVQQTAIAEDKQKITLQTVENSLKSVSEKLGIGKTIEILKSKNYLRISQIKDEDYAAILDLCEQALKTAAQ